MFFLGAREGVAAKAAQNLAQTIPGLEFGIWHGIAGPAEWSEVVALIRAGRTYANVHSVKFPGGEIRSQIDGGDDDNDDHGNHH